MLLQCIKLSFQFQPVSNPGKKQATPLSKGYPQASLPKLKTLLVMVAYRTDKSMSRVKYVSKALKCEDFVKDDTLNDLLFGYVKRNRSAGSQTK